jgi:sodium-dependent dicarboxylate transporter 2/3/5
MAPLVATMKKGDPMGKAILLGVPFAANVGGMGTIIGSPPNAIAAGLLAESAPVDFLSWMLAGLPPAVLLLALAWLFLVRSYPSQGAQIDIRGLDWETRTGSQLPMWKRLLVLPVFVLTVLLWMTGPIHQMPTAVVSFIPITLFAITGILTVHEIRRLQWDVLLLLAGGLSLGVAIRETGLALWLVDLLPAEHLSTIALAFTLAYVTTILSNFMSNTAATNILAPIAMALAAGFEAIVVIPLALGASAAMCLPISTPPNAIAYASGRLESRDFIKGGILMGLVGPAVAVLWLWWLYT